MSICTNMVADDPTLMHQQNHRELGTKRRQAFSFRHGGGGPRDHSDTSEDDERSVSDQTDKSATSPSSTSLSSHREIQVREICEEQIYGMNRDGSPKFFRFTSTAFQHVLADLLPAGERDHIAHLARLVTAMRQQWGMPFLILQVKQRRFGNEMARAYEREMQMQKRSEEAATASPSAMPRTPASLKYTSGHIPKSVPPGSHTPIFAGTSPTASAKAQALYKQRVAAKTAGLHRIQEMRERERQKEDLRQAQAKAEAAREKEAGNEEAPHGSRRSSQSGKRSSQ